MGKFKPRQRVLENLRKKLEFMNGRWMHKHNVQKKIQSTSFFFFYLSSFNHFFFLFLPFSRRVPILPWTCSWQIKRTKGVYLVENACLGYHSGDGHASCIAYWVKHIIFIGWLSLGFAYYYYYYFWYPRVSGHKA